MNNYHLTKSKMERYDIRLKSGRCQWAIISISDDGVFNAQTDCGDFSYRWGSFGDCFKSFLIDICRNDSSYLYGKIHSHDREGNIDVDKTIANMKEKIIENRKEYRNQTSYVSDYELSLDEARYLWMELDDVLSCHSEISPDAFASIFYHELPSEERNKVFSDEFWYDDILVHTSDRQAEAFCEVVAPIFGEILENELSNEQLSEKGEVA